MTTENEEFDEVQSGFNGKIVRSAKLTIGESFRGKLLGLSNSSTYPDKQNLVMEDEKGEPFTVFTSGNLSKAVKEGKLEVGQIYRITRKENNSFTGKFGKVTSTDFKIQRLRSNGTAAAPGENNAKPAGKGK